MRRHRQHSEVAQRRAKDPVNDVGLHHGRRNLLPAEPPAGLRLTRKPTQPHPTALRGNHAARTANKGAQAGGSPDEHAGAQAGVRRRRAAGLRQSYVIGTAARNNLGGDYMAGLEAGALARYRPFSSRRKG